MLNRIPFLRGLFARYRNHRQKNAQLSAYNHMMTCVGETPVSNINFNADGCVYTLNDDRKFLFDPSKSAGWLYSVPYSGVFEQKETEFVRRTVQAGWVCFDVGACFGWYSLLFNQRVGDTGQVHAFEPVPSNRECLITNLELNGATENVKVNPFALGQERGATKIYVPNDGVSGSLQAHAKLKDCQVIEIEVSTLDSYVAKSSLQRLDFIKADIEGAEFLMLKGAESTLCMYRPTLMLEVQAHSTRLFGYEPQDIFQWLFSLGYKAYYVNAEYGLVECGNQLNSLPDYNFVFKHEAQA